jgi:nucleoside-diphosphate kinase
VACPQGHAKGVGEVERTFIMVKPDGVGRGLVGEVIRRFEQKGLRLIGAKMLRIPRELAEEHYAQHREKPFYPGLIAFITSGPVVALAFEGEDAVRVARTLLGATDPKQSAPGTIRGDFALTIDCNVVHGSDSLEAAERELSLFFRPEELVSEPRPEERWLYPRRD